MDLVERSYFKRTFPTRMQVLPNLILLIVPLIATLLGFSQVYIWSAVLMVLIFIGAVYWRYRRKTNYIKKSEATYQIGFFDYWPVKERKTNFIHCSCNFDLEKDDLQTGVPRKGSLPTVKVDQLEIKFRLETIDALHVYFALQGEFGFPNEKQFSWDLKNFQKYIPKELIAKTNGGNEISVENRSSAR